jgi:ATP/maltotriose-dependent transcriptional regulator MalT
VGSSPLRGLFELAIAVRRKLSPPAQKREIVAGLNRVFAARVVGCADLRAAAHGEQGLLHATVEHGCQTSAERLQLWSAFADAVAPAIVLAGLQRKTDGLAEYATLRHDHALYSLCRARRGPMIHVLALHRDGDCAPFSEHDRELVEAFHVTCRELLDMHADLNRLPRRCHPPFELLLRGLSEKAIAAQLRLSIHTVHEYIKVIYTLYGVSSRGELIAQWLEGAARAVV